MTRRWGTRGVAVAGLASALAWLAAAAAGCSIELLTPASELRDEPQVLTIRADPPEAHPGDVVTLETLVHWPGDDWEAHWVICVPQGEDSLSSCVGDNFPDDGLVPDCLTAPDAPLCRAPSGAATQVLVPPFLQIPPDVLFPVFVELLVARSAVGWTGCRDALANAEPTSDCLLGLKVVRISSDPLPNLNPKPVALLVGGVTHDASAPLVLTEEVTDLRDFSVLLELVVDATSVDEIYPDDASPMEAALKVAWFVTCGSIDTGGLGAPPGDDSLDPADVNCTPPAGGVGPGTCVAAQATWKPQTPGTCVVHAVVLDGHGGIGHLTRVFEVRGSAARAADPTVQTCNCRADAGPALSQWLLGLLLLGWLCWRLRRRRGSSGSGL